jgi:hypothetical protein
MENQSTIDHELHLARKRAENRAYVCFGIAIILLVINLVSRNDWLRYTGQLFLICGLSSSIFLNRKIRRLNRQSELLGVDKRKDLA